MSDSDFSKDLKKLVLEHFPTISDADAKRVETIVDEEIGKVINALPDEGTASGV